EVRAALAEAAEALDLGCLQPREHLISSRLKERSRGRSHHHSPSSGRRAEDRAALLKSGGPDGAAGLEQEPGTPLSLVDPDFQEACRANIVMLVATPAGLAQAASALLLF